MTAPGPGRPDTPIAGLVELALTAPTFSQLIERTAGRPAELSLVGPARARLFVAGALAHQGPLLVVTATGREAEDLTTELKGVFGDAAAMFPSWETLPHERLSPGVDTVGTRLMMLRRLAHPEDARLGPPLQVVVTAVRSLLQPMSPQLGLVEPITLSVGQEVDFDSVIAGLVELAYTRVDMVGRRGEFAVRGGILDIFAPVAEHPVRVEFWGDEITEMRMFSIADQRSIPEVSVDTLVAVACRELLLTDDVRARAAQLAAATAAGRPKGEAAITGTLTDMLAKLAEGIPVDGMEALLPVLRPGDHVLLTDQLAEGTPVLVCDPEKVRTRAADLIKTGREFLEASWSVAALGTDAPIDVEQLGGSGFAELDDVHAAARRSGHPWWTLSQLSDESVIELDIRAAPSARGHQRDIDEIFAMLRAHVRTGGYAVMVAPGTGTAHRVVERLAESDIPAAMLESGAAPTSGIVGVLKGPLCDGVVVPGANLVVITETDLTGNRATAADGKRLAAKRRNTVDPLALAAGDLVVHDQHGIGRFVEMVERTVGGSAPRIPGAGVRVQQEGPAGRQAVCPNGFAGSAVTVCRWAGARAEPPRRQRLGQHQDQGAPRSARDRRRAGVVVRQTAGQPGPRLRARHPLAGRDGSRVRFHRDRRPAHRDHRGQGRHGIAGADGPGDLRRRRLRQDRDRDSGGVQSGQDGLQVAVLVPPRCWQNSTGTFRERMAGFPMAVEGLSRFTDAAE